VIWLLFLLSRKFWEEMSVVTSAQGVLATDGVVRTNIALRILFFLSAVDLNLLFAIRVTLSASQRESISTSNMRIEMEIRAVRMPNRIICGKAEGQYGTWELCIGWYLWWTTSRSTVGWSNCTPFFFYPRSPWIHHNLAMHGFITIVGIILKSTGL